MLKRTARGIAITLAIMLAVCAAAAFGDRSFAETTAEVTTAEEPTTENPSAEEPTAENPPAEEPTAENPPAEEPAKPEEKPIPADFTGFHKGKLYKKGKLAKGWVKYKGKKYYCKRAGVRVKGRKKISRKWYFFRRTGAQAMNDTKEKGVRYYINKYKRLEAYKKSGNYYKPNGRKMTRAQKEDYTTLRRARGIVKKITKKSMTRKQKLKVCFEYVMRFPYRQYRAFPAHDKAWAALYANDHFLRGGGDCHSDAAAFAYLARAIGYKKVWICVDAALAAPDHHAWTYVNGRYYDPLFAQAKSYARYWDAKTYPYGHTVDWKVAVGYVGDK